VIRALKNRRKLFETKKRKKIQRLPTENKEEKRKKITSLSKRKNKDIPS
jgi:hypothetical protein